MTTAAIEKLRARIAAVDSFLCVGLDSALGRIGDPVRSEPRPQAALNRAVIAATHPYAAAYKPNLAFYEARGAAGWDELGETMSLLRDEHPDIFTIADAKRADIDSTNAGYVTGLLDELGFDAITLHPYLGAEALRPFLDRADKACIVLCRTSNPGAGELQDQRVGDEALWELVAHRVDREWNANGNCMLVVGATYPDELGRARQIAPRLPFLVPGVGAQGGDVAAVVERGLDANGGGLLINASRSIIFAEDPGSAAEGLRDAIRAARDAALEGRSGGGDGTA